MDNSEKNVTSLRYKSISFCLSAFVSIIGLLVLFGWTFDVAILKSILPNWVSMKANTAICFLLSGIVLILLNDKFRETIPSKYKIAATIISFIIIVIGAISFFEYLFNFNAGIDELIFKDDSNAIDTSNPGRMAPSTALCFMFFGTIFLLVQLEKKFFLISQLLIHVCGTISYFAFLGYIYDANLMKGIPSYTVMAFSTAVCMFILALGSLFLRPSIGLMKHISDNTYGSRFFRIGLPLVLFLIITLGWIHHKGEILNLWNSNYGNALFVLFLGFILAILFWFFSIRISKSEILIINKNEEIEAQNEEYIQINEELRESKETLEENEKKYRYLFENSPVGIYRTKIDGSKILEINNTACSMLGFTKEELLQQPSAIRWAEPNKRNEILKQLKEFGVAINFDADILKKDNSRISCLLSMKIFEEKGYIEGFIVDISERKNAEILVVEKNEQIEAQNEEYKQINEELFETKEKAEELSRNWQATFDAISDFVLLLSPDHNIININKSCLESLNKNLNEVIGKKCYNLIHNKGRSAIFFLLKP